jgi:DNA-binding response OmpR family regulator
MPTSVMSSRSCSKTRDHRVVVAHDGAQALDVCREHVPDVVVLNVMMPRTSGLDVCRAMRADPNPDIADAPVILLSALTSETDIETGFAAGADDYLTKPFSPRELNARVDAALARRAR